MKYSIITVNYNNKEGLLRTIISVTSQTYHDYEFIIIDGGSTDGSYDLLKEYNDKISYWVSEPDGGIYQGMNKGIKIASGDYLNFMNSGDCFYDKFVLQTVANYNYDGDIIIGRDYHFDAIKQKGHASIQPSRLSMITFFTSTLDHQSSFIKKSLFENTKYREDLRLVSDWVFFLEKVVIEDRKVQFIPNIICERELCGITWKQYDVNLSERDNYLHNLLPIGVYNDYLTLTRLDKESLYRLFYFCEHSTPRKLLTMCIKIIFRLTKILKLA